MTCGRYAYSVSMATVALTLLVCLYGLVQARHISPGPSWRHGPSPLSNDLKVTSKRTTGSDYGNQAMRLDTQRNIQLLRRINNYAWRSWPHTPGYHGNQQQVYPHDNAYDIVSNSANNFIRAQIVHRKTDAKYMYNNERTKLNRNRIVNYHHSDNKRMRSGHDRGVRIIPPSIKSTRHSRHSIRTLSRPHLITSPGRNIRITLHINNARRGTSMVYSGNNDGYKHTVAIKTGNYGTVESSRIRVNRRKMLQMTREITPTYPRSQGTQESDIISTKVVDSKLRDAVATVGNIAVNVDTSLSRGNVREITNDATIANTKLMTFHGPYDGPHRMDSETSSVQGGVSTRDIHSVNISTLHKQHKYNNEIQSERKKHLRSTSTSKPGVKPLESQHIRAGNSTHTTERMSSVPVSDTLQQYETIPEQIRVSSRLLPKQTDKQSTPTKRLTVFSENKSPLYISPKHSGKVLISKAAVTLPERSGNLSPASDTHAKHSKNASGISVTVTTEEPDLPDIPGVTEVPDATDIPEIS